MNLENIITICVEAEVLSESKRSKDLFERRVHAAGGPLSPILFCSMLMELEANTKPETPLKDLGFDPRGLIQKLECEYNVAISPEITLLGLANILP